MPRRGCDALLKADSKGIFANSVSKPRDKRQRLGEA
jgi:hypothetical protein